MKNYYRVRLGPKNAFAKQSFDGNFIGIDSGISVDLTPNLPEDWHDFNAYYIPEYQKEHPGTKNAVAGLFCGLLWTVAKGLEIGDIVLCPDGTSAYKVGEITSAYLYVPESNLPHRRSVKWYSQKIDRDSMSEELKSTAGSSVTVCDLNRFGPEIEKLIGSVSPIISTDPEIESPKSFVLENQLEEFLVQNWANTELGKELDLYEVDGQLFCQQVDTDTGPLDILAISKDKKRLVVVELKKGRASDSVVGQVLRYMGYIKAEYANEGQIVEGIIIALEDNQAIRRALEMVQNVTFYRYQMSFKLVKA